MAASLGSGVDGSLRLRTRSPPAGVGVNPPVVYTDGACRGNPGPGGWAWVQPDGPFASGAEAASTNQRMEIAAALEAVRALQGPLEVRSDSTYVVNCFRDRWWAGWLAKGWVNSQRKPVANQDLWAPLIELYQALGGADAIRFVWVKGHAGDPWNEVADRLAVEAADTQRGRSGGSPPSPDAIGPPDETGPRPARRLGAASYAEGVAGRPLVVFGQGRAELADREAAVRERLRRIIEAKSALDPELVVVSGLRLGAEQLGAEAALAAGVPFVAVLPFPDPEARWPAPDRRRFADLAAAAADRLVLERRSPDTPAKVAGALRRRDAWLTRHAAEAILVWDGRDARLAKLHRTLEHDLGEDVWVLDPNEVQA
ncbi:MAG: ribonuclease H [Acidimicrobiales bacterium]